MELSKIWDCLEYIGEIGIYSEIFSHFTYFEIENLYQNNKERLNKIYDNEQFWYVMLKIRYSKEEYDETWTYIIQNTIIGGRILYMELITTEYIFKRNDS